MNVLITGGSGLVGRRLTTMLVSEGFSVGTLTRSVKQIPGIKEFEWDIDRGYLDNSALIWADHIIHLAGETLGQRWTPEAKKKILSSRKRTTKLLAEELRANYSIKSFLAASAIGYYGNTGDADIDEKSPNGTGFLAEVTQQWENTIEEVKPHVERLVKFRIGIVLSSSGGALGKMNLPIRYGVGAPVGSGKQWMSWIDLDDLCRMFIFALKTSLSGTYNAVAPEPVTNKAMTCALATQLNRPLILPNVPGFVLKAMLGEMSIMVLDGNKVSAAAIQKEGFKFDYDTLEKSLDHLF